MPLSNVITWLGFVPWSGIARYDHGCTRIPWVTDRHPGHRARDIPCIRWGQEEHINVLHVLPNDQCVTLTILLRGGGGDQNFQEGTFYRNIEAPLSLESLPVYFPKLPNICPNFVRMTRLRKYWWWLGGGGGGGGGGGTVTPPLPFHTPMHGSNIQGLSSPSSFHIRKSGRIWMRPILIKIIFILFSDEILSATET